MPPKSKMASDSDMTSSVGVLNKWLKAQGISITVDIPAQNLPDGLQHGILFLDYLRSSRHFPAKLTQGEINLLQVIEELSSRIDHSANGASAESSKVSKRKQEDKENVPKGNAKLVKKAEKEGESRKADKPGPKSRKLAPLSAAAASNQQSKGCGCKGECKTKVCGCVKRNAQCSSPCKCLDSCVNKKKESQRKPESEEEEEEEVEENTKTANAKIAKSGSEEDLSSEEELSGDEAGDGLGESH